jgi:hypothetical protein
MLMVDINPATPEMETGGSRLETCLGKKCKMLSEK